eukprot:COSAG02_NODE_424_length_22575_cov_79.088361_18_plen_178_part_00
MLLLLWESRRRNFKRLSFETFDLWTSETRSLTFADGRRDRFSSSEPLNVRFSIGIGHSHVKERIFLPLWAAAAARGRRRAAAPARLRVAADGWHALHEWYTHGSVERNEALRGALEVQHACQWKYCGRHGVHLRSFADRPGHGSTHPSPPCRAVRMLCRAVWGGSSLSCCIALRAAI